MTETITITVPVTAGPGVSMEPTHRARHPDHRHCEKRADKRTKLYDRKAPDLYVSINGDGVATFYFRYTDRFTGKARACGSASISPDTSTSMMPAPRLYALKARIGMGEIVCRDVATARR